MKEKMPSMVKEVEVTSDDIKLEKKTSVKKYPKISLSKLDEGHIELGPDNETKYIVSKNKLGRKFWKKVSE